MPVADLTAKQAREKLAAKQEELGKVFAEALVTGDSGQKQYDFNKVTCLGADVKGSIAVAEKVQQLNLEANELAQHAETLEGAEKAAAEHADREKGVNRPPFPGQDGGGKGRQVVQLKSLGQRLTEAKSYKAWLEGGKSGDVVVQLDDVMPSDFLGKAATFDTIGSKALMETGSGYAPESIRQPGFVEGVTRPIQLLDIIPIFPTSMDTIKFMEETTRTHGAAEKAEGATYAESAFAFTERSSPVEKITDSLPITDEQLDDVPMMAGYVNSRLGFGVRQKFDGQTLIGSGTPPALRGLKNVSGIQTQARGADPVPDAYFKAMTKVRLVGRAVPTHNLIHPTDWENIRLLRTADGVYIWGSPSEAGPERLWGLPVVQEDVDDVGRGYVGSFQPAWVAAYEKQGVDIQIGYTGTQFVEGKRTVRASIRVAIVFRRPAAFCEVTGLS